MTYLNAAPSKFFAAFSATTITAIMAASIIFGMAGLPDHGASLQLASAPAQHAAHG